MIEYDEGGCRQLMCAIVEQAIVDARGGSWEAREWLVCDGVGYATHALEVADVNLNMEALLVSAAQPRIGRGWTVADIRAWHERRRREAAQKVPRKRAPLTEQERERERLRSKERRQRIRAEKEARGEITRRPRPRVVQTEMQLTGPASTVRKRLPAQIKRIEDTWD